MKNLLQQEAVSESWNHWKTVVQRTSHSQKQLAPFKRQRGERTMQNSDEGYEQGMFRFFEEVRTHLAVTGWLCGTHNSLRSQLRRRLGPVATVKEGWGQGAQRQRDFQCSETTHSQGRHTGEMYKVKLGPSSQGNKKARYVVKGFKQVKDWTTLKSLCLPVSRRHSRFCFNYQRSRVILCTSLISKQFFCTHQ